MVCGVYVWGTLVVSRTTGILCAFLVLFLPDASTYGFKNGFFSFHWLLLTSPGTGYALGIVLTTCSLLYIWRTKGSRSALFLALATAIAVLFFRIQIFLLYLPALLATMVFENQSLKQYRLGLVLMMSGLAPRSRSSSCYGYHLHKKAGLTIPTLRILSGSLTSTKSRPVIRIWQNG